MKLKSTRPIQELKEVLYNPNSKGPQEAYWVFSELGHKKWENMTIISPGTYDKEFNKTYGHYNSVDINETYKLLSGKGILMLQKKFYENNNWIQNKVEQVCFITANPGDEIIITPEWGHAWTNMGDLPLISLDTWRSGHKPSDYENIKKLQGMAYYLIKEKNDVKIVPNPNYENLPEPKWITPQEFTNI